MKKIATSLLVAGTLFASVVAAAPVTLDCRASGAAGTVAFRLVFDEAAKQASAVWSSGGGRPSAPLFGEAGSEHSLGPVGVDAVSIVVPFRQAIPDDPYAYLVAIDRTDGKLRFTRYG